MQPMLSVLVPVYNVAPYLARCLDSILAQTYRALDIVLVDDGSTDGSGAICDAYAARDARIRVVHKANGGLVSARKEGLRHADPSAPYATFVDSDDWIEPDAYADMMQAMAERPADCVIAGHYEDTGESRRAVVPDFEAGFYDRARMERDFLPRMMAREPFYTWGLFCSFWNKIFSKALLAPILSEEDERIRLGEDVAVVYPVLYRAQSVALLHRCYYHYVQHPQSMVKSTEPLAVERERMRVLDQFVRARLPQSAQEKWVVHMLFSMIPRADTLYEGWESLEYLFPFPMVKRGARIILYGAGTYGQRLYQAIRCTGIVTIAGWADRNAAVLQKLGLPVEPPEAIAAMEADDIVLALSFGRSREGAKRDLEQRFPGKRVHAMDVPLVFSEETRRAFRLA
ncbi:glycosyltransferase family 2 protein [uncultured Selenomonas sp.]|uniref:glycosyltransferase family 2 protein n=1 Tax=uncultured Selenomonas sp. TaxID=159275 RepID=UPI0025CEC842|nr:glycosyltransferase family 2 protein [uncultured Selenomonas sp.]